jgi:hypothetical protein
MVTEPYQNDGRRHDTTELSAVEVRQGVISGRVLLVLMVSLLLAVVGLTVGYFVVH